MPPTPDLMHPRLHSKPFSTKIKKERNPSSLTKETRSQKHLSNAGKEKTVKTKGDKKKGK